MALSAALGLAAAAVLVIPVGPAVTVSRTRPARRSPPPSVRGALVLTSGVLAVGVLAGWVWPLVLAGAGAGGAASFLVPSRPSARQRRAERAQLAVHADLFAACLDAGMAVGPALAAVADTLQPMGGAGSPQSRRRVPTPASLLRWIPAAPVAPLDSLRAVAGLLALGAAPEVAWRPAECHRDLLPLAAAARRSASAGTLLADAVREHGAQVRRELAQESERAAGRAGIAMTAPLGLCFLPAFLCLGLAPVVVGLLGTLGIF